jgi:hypothetical protein
MTSPQFFRELIENAATVDATTRQHVAFVVFYGDRSGVVRAGDIGYEPHSGRAEKGGLKVRFDGLSISGDPYVRSDFVVRPTIRPRPERNRFERNYPGLVRRSPQELFWDKKLFPDEELFSNEDEELIA